MNKLVETKKAYNETVIMLSAQIKSLETIINTIPVHKETLQPIVNEKLALLDMVAKMKSWNFNFVGGGWNSVSARTKEEAIEIAKEQYNETEQRYHCKENGGGAIPLMKVNEKTFRVATEADTNACLSLFY